MDVGSLSREELPNPCTLSGRYHEGAFSQQVRLPPLPLPRLIPPSSEIPRSCLARALPSIPRPSTTTRSGPSTPSRRWDLVANPLANNANRCGSTKSATLATRWVCAGGDPTADGLPPLLPEQRDYNPRLGRHADFIEGTSHLAKFPPPFVATLNGQKRLTEDSRLPVSVTF